ncbi:MAG TPA: hypothetical protein VHB30_00585 [Solirubrobacteraceae bacterium]|nr:hypothetical protein [Solirubrobacteraceae bacterium]
MSGDYTRGEVAYLLSLSLEDARVEDEGVRSFLGNLTSGGPSTSASDGSGRLPTVARWHDVHGALARVKARRSGAVRASAAVAVGLAVRGVSERAIAAAIGVSQSSAHRYIRRTLDEVLDELGGEAQPPRGFDQDSPACLKCGVHARAILKPVERHVYGVGKRVVRRARQSGLCVACMAPEFRELVADDRGVWW